MVKYLLCKKEVMGSVLEASNQFFRHCSSVSVLINSQAGEPKENGF
jgi:hypothetical protein